MMTISFFFGCYRKKAPPLSFLTFCKIFFLSLIGYVLCSTSKTLMNIMARIKFFKFFFFFEFQDNFQLGLVWYCFDLYFSNFGCCNYKLPSCYYFLPCSSAQVIYLIQLLELSSNRMNSFIKQIQRCFIKALILNMHRLTIKLFCA